MDPITQLALQEKITIHHPVAIDVEEMNKP